MILRRFQGTHIKHVNLLHDRHHDMLMHAFYFYMFMKAVV